MDKTCIECGSQDVHAKGLCRKCYCYQYYTKNKEKIKASIHKKRKQNPEKYRAISTKNNRQRGHVSMSDNQKCSLFLGVHVAENVLSMVFKDVVRQPHGNPGFDFICNKGMKIDVKSTCLCVGGVNKRASWNFDIKKNKIADYFLCLAFDNRKNLNPVHMWLLPSIDFNHLSQAVISINTINKWKKYTLDVYKVSKCCDVLR